MGIGDDVRAISDTMPATHKLAWILNELGEKDGQELLDLIADPTVRQIAIWRVLHARGFDVSGESVNGWARKARRGSR